MFPNSLMSTGTETGKGSEGRKPSRNCGELSYLATPSDTVGPVYPPQVMASHNV